MYATTGIATDSARKQKANFWARTLAKPCRRLFQAKPMPELQNPRPRPLGIAEPASALRVVQ